MKTLNRYAEARGAKLHNSPITAISDTKLQAQQKVTKGDIGLKLETAWKPKPSLEISGSFPDSYTLSRERSNLRLPRFTMAVATSYQDANKSFKDGSNI